MLVTHVVVVEWLVDALVLKVVVVLLDVVQLVVVDLLVTQVVVVVWLVEPLVLNVVVVL